MKQNILLTAGALGIRRHEMIANITQSMSPRHKQRIPILSAIWVHNYNFSLLCAGQHRCVLAYRSAAKIRQNWRRLTIMFRRRFQMTVWSNFLIASIRLVIGLSILGQCFFNQWEAKAIAPCTRAFSCALSYLQIIARNSDWFIALFAPVVIGQGNYVGIAFSAVICKPQRPPALCVQVQNVYMTY